MAKGKRVTSSEFKGMKGLLEQTRTHNPNVSENEVYKIVANVYNRSNGTVRRVDEFDNYKDYCNRNRTPVKKVETGLSGAIKNAEKEKIDRSQVGLLMLDELKTLNSNFERLIEVLDGKLSLQGNKLGEVVQLLHEYMEPEVMEAVDTGRPDETINDDYPNQILPEEEDSEIA